MICECSYLAQLFLCIYESTNTLYTRTISRHERFEHATNPWGQPWWWDLPEHNTARHTAVLGSRVCERLLWWERVRRAPLQQGHNSNHQSECGRNHHGCANYSIIVQPTQRSQIAAVRTLMLHASAITPASSSDCGGRRRETQHNLQQYEYNGTSYHI